MYFGLICSIFIALSYVQEGLAVQCYQCSSAEDAEGEDNCGAYKKFNKDRHIAVECSSDESVTPGTFCMKITQQGPRGFIWDGRWRQVIRRCASVAETGVTGVCNWGVMENGVYWEECYCSGDGCNSASFLSFSPTLATLCILVAISKFLPL
ncbi:uncharacterized protein LOC111062499 [Nilaparvata lugens]|uniref:uncharacterized protein LOC111062499 n=1 Tax=Nilaparvata lugens TaxID=108931 RepID=UPI000B9873AC|nr:uncharacterized protein LOC111062499 [Nilaparvata lugens]